jgi:DNA uptake protein ComE-like DNA-binding protein
VVSDEPEEADISSPRFRLVGWVLRILIAMGLIVAGAAGGVWWSTRHGGGMTTREQAPLAVRPATPTATAPADEALVEVSITADAVRRAGIKTARVTAATTTSTLTVPATVTSNAYRDTKVNALVGGVVRQVRAELGAVVTRGEVLAVVFSAELADAQMKYLSAGAMAEADHQKLERTTKLVEIGAASRQELEEVRAIHAGHATEVAAARQRRSSR